MIEFLGYIGIKTIAVIMIIKIPIINPIIIHNPLILSISMNSIFNYNSKILAQFFFKQKMII